MGIFSQNPEVDIRIGSKADKTNNTECVNLWINVVCFVSPAVISFQSHFLCLASTSYESLYVLSPSVGSHLY